MAPKSTCLFLLIAATFMLLQCHAQNPMGANDGEKQVCEDNKGDREVEFAMKDRPLSCVVRCTYSDGETETYNSPDGQQCCMAGGQATACCKDGVCPPPSADSLQCLI